MEVAWQQLDPRLRGVDGLDDIMRFDLQHFCRRMQPPDEPHYWWVTLGSKTFSFDVKTALWSYCINKCPV